MNRKDWIKAAGLLGAGMLAKPLHAAQLWNGDFPEAGYSRADFGPDFEWGVATAAYQIEGAWNVDGKGESVWDHFTHTKKRRIINKENGDVTCDFYHHYAEDLALMAGMNIPNNRFSIAWSRVIPKGTGQVNEKGLDFYDRVIDKTLELGMEPWVTLYHWDLPQALEEKGGWVNICKKSFK